MKKRKLSAALKTLQVQQGKARRQDKHPVKVGKRKKPDTSTPVSYAESHIPWHVWSDASGRRQQHTRLPFHPAFTSQILLCGEGDFSYCRSLVETFERSADHGKWCIVATALDSRDTVIRKYHERAQSNLDFLEAADRNLNVTLLFGVDATRLHANKTLLKLFKSKKNPSSPCPSRIIFNFPHSGAGIKDREHNILAQQKLLLGFFNSCVGLLDALRIANDAKSCSYTTTMMRKLKQRDAVGEVKQKHDSEDEGEHEHGTLDVDERGEAFEIHIALKTGDPYDAWNVKSLAASTKRLHCSQSFRFMPDSYPGYHHCRTIGGAGDELVNSDSWTEFLSGKPAKTFVFTLNK